MAPTPAPTRADKFSFGLWTIGYQGIDMFGGPTRPPLDVVQAVEKLDELGAYGLTFHDDDLFAFGSDDTERQRQIDRLKGALKAMKGAKYDAAKTTEEIVGFADIARREGLLALEEKIKTVEEPFLIALAVASAPALPACSRRLA